MQFLICNALSTLLPDAWIFLCFQTMIPNLCQNLYPFSRNVGQLVNSIRLINSSKAYLRDILESHYREIRVLQEEYVSNGFSMLLCIVVGLGFKFVLGSNQYSSTCCEQKR